MPLRAQDLSAVSRETDRLTKVVRPALLTPIERNLSLIESVMKPTFLRDLEDQHRLLNGPLRSLLEDLELQRASLLAAVQPLVAQASFTAALPIMDVIRTSAQWDLALAGVTESMVTDVLKTLRFTDPLADFRATLDVVLDHVAAEAEQMEDPGPLANPAYRARQAMRQALIVIGFLLAAATVQQPREPQSILGYLFTLWSIVMLVDFVIGDE